MQQNHFSAMDFAPISRSSNNKRTPRKVLTMNLKQTIRNWRKVRKTENELYGLSTRELDDLGISRGEIPTIARRSIG